ncbi:MAG: hypothetical protein P9M03_00615 [Candidatus Theseobacter exili]|nr:hypothetical protein [Candidatus Theseobacter exili]
MKKLITVGIMSLVILLGTGLSKAEAGHRYGHHRRHPGYHSQHAYGYGHRPYYRPSRSYYNRPYYYPEAVYYNSGPGCVVVF